MKRFLLNLVFIFFLPLFLIFASSEILLRSRMNEYKYKNSYLEKNKSTIELLCLGPSSGYFGINPHYFNMKAFNATHVSQTINYDNFLWEKFAGQMASLKCVILTIDYWSPFTTLETSGEPWRTKNYRLYYGCNYHKYDPKSIFETYNFNLVLWKRVYNSLDDLFKGRVELGIDSLGYGTDYTLSKRSIDWQGGGPYSAKRHTKKIDIGILNQNAQYIDQICRKCQEKNIIVLLLTTPAWATYVENLNRNQQDLMNRFCNSFPSKYPNTYYISMLEDNRFSEIDFYDTNHLNEFGAKKLSLIINDTITYFQHQKSIFPTNKKSQTGYFER